MKKVVIAGFVAGLVVIGGFLAWTMTKDPKTANQNTNTTNQPQNQQQTQGANNNQQSSVSEFTKEDVAKHSTKEDCWTIIDNTIYNLTSYIPRHPGGSEILEACGKDGSSLFNERKTESGQSVGSGEPHSRSASAMLASLKVGTLKN